MISHFTHALVYIIHIYIYEFYVNDPYTLLDRYCVLT